MTTDDDLTPEDVLILDDLIRRAREESTTDDGPDQAALIAFVRGQATPEQRERVQRALEASVRLREDVTYLAGLYDRDVQKRYDEAPVPRRPSPERPMRSKNKERHGHSTDTRQASASRRGWLRLLWGLPALAALVILLLVGRHPRPVHSWAEASRITIDQLAKEPLRGIARDVTLTTAQERATWTLVSALDQVGGDLRVNTLQHFEVGGDRIPLGSARSAGDGLAVEPPLAGVTDREVWFLSLPSLRLFRARLDGNPASMPWPVQEERDGVLTLTFRQGGAFEATVPVECRRR